MVKAIKTKYDQKYVPERGDIIWMNFNPTRGHEQSGKRPALVLSPKIYNTKSDLAIFCPITSRIKSYSFRVDYQREKVSGSILCDQIKNIDWKERKVIFITKIDETILTSVHNKIKLLLEF